MQIKYEGCAIFVDDIPASRHFYEQLLGQEVDIDFGPNVGFKNGFALWQVGHAYEIIYGRAPDQSERLGHRNSELIFETGELEALSARLSEAGVEFVHSLHEQPWAQRVFRVYDPDGHVVELAEPMDTVVDRLLAQGMSPDAVSQRTGMPLAVVEQVAGG
jgi:catechol 2,3-dioxygenase-like lactoylglutathione lyase family enzyme